MAITDTARKPRGPWRWEPYLRDATRMTVPSLLWTLHELGGHIEDRPTGRSGRNLVEEAKKRGYTIDRVHDVTRQTGRASGGALSQLLSELDYGRFAGCIARETNGKRTLRIDLLLDETEMPPKPHPVVIRQAADTPAKPRVGDTKPAPDNPPAPTPPSEPTPAPSEPAAADGPNGGDAFLVEPTLAVVDREPEPDPVQPTIPPLVLADGSTMDLLLQIQQLTVQAGIACARDMGDNSAPAPDAQGEAVAERLATTLDENNRLRAKLNDLSETMRAKSRENEALRRQIMLLQNNLRVIQEASANAPQVERNLARLRGNQQFIAARPEPAIAARQ